jgi:hypothetical protein
MDLEQEVTEIIFKKRKKFSFEKLFSIYCKKHNIDVLDDENKIKKIIVNNSNKLDGKFLIFPDGEIIARKIFDDKLRKKVKQQLKNQGFQLTNNSIKELNTNSKNVIRKLHESARKDKYMSNKDFIDNNENDLVKYFANGHEIDVENIKPKIKIVKIKTLENSLFRFACLLWSVPVSVGFGRRTRFIVFDDYNKKIIGIFALGDPVISLSCRDNLIGWNVEQKNKRLYNVMDLFILGAVPPYNILLGGKLISMISSTNKVRNIIKNKYKNNITIIKGEKKNPELALLTTASALGKSSVYDRINFKNRKLFQSIGYSKGYGHFHLNNGLFTEMREHVEMVKPAYHKNYKYGNGPNWKMRLAKKSLGLLGFSGDLLKHGIQREIFAIPLAKNYIEFLMGEENHLKPFNIPDNEVIEFWKERWLYNRAIRKPEYKDFKRESILEMIHSFDI